MSNTHSDASEPEESPMEVVVIDDDVVIEEDEDIDAEVEKPDKKPQGSRKDLGKT